MTSYPTGTFTAATRSDATKSFVAPVRRMALSCRWPQLTEAHLRDGDRCSLKAVRDYALQKTMRAMNIRTACGAKVFVLGGREGVETDGISHPRLSSLSD